MEKESVGRQKATRNPDGEAVEREKKAEFYLFIYIAGDDASAKDSSQYL